MSKRRTQGGPKEREPELLRQKTYAEIVHHKLTTEYVMDGLGTKDASVLLRECREGKHGEEARKVVEELDCLAAPRMMCIHEWAFLRQEMGHYKRTTSTRGWGDMQTLDVDILEDVFYCRRCLEYRRVEGK